jgi:hypothetical protein
LGAVTHHRMNLQRSEAGKMASPGLIDLFEARLKRIARPRMELP